MTAYLISMATFVGFFMILALALNLQWGMTGMVNFGIAGFYALGAYTSGLLTTKLAVPVGFAIPLACLAGLAVGALVALLSMRLREDFLAIVTLLTTAQRILSSARKLRDEDEAPLLAAGEPDDE